MKGVGLRVDGGCSLTTAPHRLPAVWGYRRGGEMEKPSLCRFEGHPRKTPFKGRRKDQGSEQR